MQIVNDAVVYNVPVYAKDSPGVIFHTLFRSEAGVWIYVKTISPWALTKKEAEWLAKKVIDVMYLTFGPASMDQSLDCETLSQLIIRSTMTPPCD